MSKAPVLTPWKYKRHVYGAVAAAGLLHLTLLVLAGRQHKLSVSNKHPLLIALTIALPEIFIWIVAFVGAVRFKKYASSIRGHADGGALNSIANGLLLIGTYVVVLPLSGAVVTLVRPTSFLQPAVAIENHLPIAIFLLASWFLLQGARSLNGIVPLTVRRAHWAGLAVAVGLLMAAFAYMFYQEGAQSAIDQGIPRFVLPRGVLLVTYVLPHVLSWVAGLYVCLSLANYARHSKGAIYRGMFRLACLGILIVLLCTLLAQIIIMSSRGVHGLNLTLLLIYGLLLLTLAGFLLLYEGARQLEKIEAV